MAPAATVRLFANRMAAWQIGSVLLAAAEGTVGLWLSVKTNAPPGATIATLSGAVFGVAAARAGDRPAPGRLAVAAPLAAGLLVAGCGGSGSDSGKVAVVATTTQIGDFVREVGGDNVDVHQILAPNTDPHDYEPRPDDVTNTADAKIVFTNGDDLDSWMDKVVSDSGSDANVVDLGATVPVKLPGRIERSRGLTVRPTLVARPAKCGGGGAPDRGSALGDRSQAQGQLRDQRRRIRGEAEARWTAGSCSCFDEIPAADRKLVTDHDAFDYFANRYGIQVVGAVIPSQTTQAQPNAQDLSNLAELIGREHVKAIFPESSLSPKLAETIASQTGASVDYTLYGDTLGPERIERRHLSGDGGRRTRRDGRGLHGGRRRRSRMAECSPGP